MPDPETIQRAEQDKREGKAPSTQAGEFVREEIHHLREGKHGAASPEQAIAIGLSKARRAGVELQPPDAGEASPATRRKARGDLARGKRRAKPKSRARSRAVKSALKRKSRGAGSRAALARQARSASRRRGAADRRAAARKAAATRRRSGTRVRKAAGTRRRAARR